MGHACCRPPQLRFVGLHFPFLSYTQSYATTWLHSGLLYFRPALAGLLCSAGMSPRGEGGFSLGWLMNGCMGAIPRHALCHPSGVRICFFVAVPGVWGFESALSTPTQAAPCGAPVSAAVQLRRGRSPLHRRAILWRPSGAHKFGGHAPARPVFAARAIARAATPWQGR